ncbi:MAG: ribosomal protein S18-alanine N-acetyltransferase [Ilumatobacteraceae bacterium]
MKSLDRFSLRPATRVPAGVRTVVEPMRRRDLPEVMRIEQVSYPSPWSAEVFRSEIARVPRGDRHYLVLRRGGALLGYGGLMFAVDEAHVTNVAVSPDHQRQGLATRVLAELSWHAVARGSVGLTLEVRVSNVAAQGLYRRFGFESAGVRVRYYENTEDAMVMWCHGIQSDEFAARLRSVCPEAAR